MGYTNSRLSERSYCIRSYCLNTYFSKNKYLNNKSYHLLSLSDIPASTSSIYDICSDMSVCIKCMCPPAAYTHVLELLDIDIVTILIYLIYLILDTDTS